MLRGLVELMVAGQEWNLNVKVWITFEISVLDTSIDYEL